MGIALGQMGMTAESFYQLTPSEFEEAYLKWSDKRDGDFKNGWLQTRKICFHVAAPYLKKGATEKSIMRFPWEEGKRGQNKTETAKPDPERLAKLKEKYGDQIPVHN